MTRINIQGTEYDLTEAVSAAGLGTLRVLKKITAGEGHTVTLKSINNLFSELGKRAESGDFSPIDLLEDDEFLITMQAVLWLVLRKAGQSVTFEQVGEIAFTEFTIVADEDEAEPDPKALPVSGEADAA